MLMNYDFLICGHYIRFELPWELAVTTETVPFLIDRDAHGIPELTVTFSPVDSLRLPETEGVWHINALYTANNGVSRVWHCASRSDPPYCCVEWNTLRPSAVECRYVRGQEHQIIYTKNLMELLGLETILLHFDALIAHASLVEWEGRGILFCAPSGTGKSTQAQLWQQYMGSRTLNGDRAGICCRQGRWEAWGLPYAGTSGIYCNRSVPVSMVVLLRQGSQNVITSPGPVDAFKQLFPQMNARRWDADFMEHMTALLSSLVGQVPICQLECKPDVEAVELLHRVLIKENLHGNGIDAG